MRIGELAERVGTSTRSLRYYEKQGLLSSARDANCYRHYDELALVRARNIKHLLDAGLTTEDIRAVPEDCLASPLPNTDGCADGLALVRQRLAAVDKRIDSLLRLRERLASHYADLEAAEPDRRLNPSAESVG